MKTGNMVALGEIAEFIRGITYKPSDVRERVAGAVPCMRTANIQADLDDADLICIDRDLVKEPRWLRERDILVSSANSWNLVGKCSWVPRLPYEATFGGFTSVLRPSRDALDPRFLFHWFRTAAVQRLARSFGQQTTNISNLNQTRCLAELKLTLPAPSEQRRIVSILDKADALRRKRERATALFNDLDEADFIETERRSDARIHRLGDFGDVKGGKRLPKGHDYATEETGFKYFRVTDIQNGRARRSDLKNLKPESAHAVRRYTVQKGDVAITIAGTIGVTCYISDDLSGVNLTENAAKIVIRERSLVDPIYLTHALRSSDAQAQIAMSTGQVTIGKLALFRIEELKVALPGIEDQRAFVRRAQSREKLRGGLERAAAASGALFRSLQHRAFSGQL